MGQYHGVVDAERAPKQGLVWVPLAPAKIGDSVELLDFILNRGMVSSSLTFQGFGQV